MADQERSPSNAKGRPFKRVLGIVGLLLVLALTSLAYYLLRPLAHTPTPADFHAYDLSQGRFVPLEPPPQAFAIGLSYAAHIEETASHFDPEVAPPIFRKDGRAFARSGSRVQRPSPDALMAAADELEPGLGKAIRERHGELAALLDYEGELGFVLLEDLDPAELARPDFVPSLGFFVSNDLSARSLAIMGEGRPNRYDYWGISKSFPGFMPVPDQAWVPDDPKPNGIPFVVIETKVDGEVRQSQSTKTLIYTPREMLRFINKRYPESPLRKGTLVFTGTPGGVAMTTPRWLVRAANLAGLDRHRKLAIKLKGDRSLFLEPGDRVDVSAEGLGSVSVEIIAGTDGGS